MLLHLLNNFNQIIIDRQHKILENFKALVASHILLVPFGC